MSKDTNTPQLKAEYSRPELSVFGSVRNLTGGSVATATDDLGNMMNRSDPAAKENVALVGTHPLGFGLYLFDYKAEFAADGEGRQFGVMADEVAKIVPEAVAEGEDGYLRVNYAMLGITRH
ncbi:MAG: tail fiber domain-containing protein [Alteraurantiacibacter sp.]